MSDNFFRVNKGIKLNPSDAPVSPEQGEIYNDIVDNKIKVIGPIQSIDLSTSASIQIDPINSIIKSDGSVIQNDGFNNLINNSSFENGLVTGWEDVSLTLDPGTGVATGVIASGGTATLSIESTSPIRGAHSLKFTNSGVNGIGFWSDPFVLNEFNYSSANYSRFIGGVLKILTGSTSNIRYAIYNVTTGNIYSTPDFPSVPVSSFADNYVTDYFNDFWPPSLGDSIRIVVYQGAPSLTTITPYELVIDDLFFGVLNQAGLGFTMQGKIGPKGGFVDQGNLIVNGPIDPIYNMGPLRTTMLSGNFSDLIINTPTFDSGPGVPTDDITVKTGDWIGTAIPSYPQGGTGDLNLGTGDLTATGLAFGNTSGSTYLKTGISSYNDTGEISVFTGDAGNSSGTISLTTGSGAGSGDINLTTGAATVTRGDVNIGGKVVVVEGSSDGSTIGINIKTSAATTPLRSGTITISTGAGLTSVEDTGDIILETGNTSTGLRGAITLDGDSLTVVSNGQAIDTLTENGFSLGYNINTTNPRYIHLQDHNGNGVNLKSSYTSSLYDIVLPSSSPATDTLLLYNGTDYVWSNSLSNFTLITPTINQINDVQYIFNELGNSIYIKSENPSAIINTNAYIEIAAGDDIIPTSSSLTLGINGIPSITLTNSATFIKKGVYLTSTSGGGYVNLSTPTGLSATYTLEFPNSAPSTNYSLTSAGGSTLDWYNFTPSVSTNATLTGASPTITIDTTTKNLNQVIVVSGATADVTLSTTPFGSTAPVINGTNIRLIGASDANNVTIISSDISKGAVLNGNATLYKNSVLTLQYISSLDRYVEIGRNF